jgi:DNA invertase Pin-like site-specific DNA recombinase
VNSTILNIERTATPSREKALHVINPLEQLPSKLRVAAYCRVSSNSDEQQNSYASQVRYYTTVIGENPDWELVDVYADDAETGLSTANRSDFLRMMSDCRAGRINRIYVKSISRFARNFTDCIENIHELKRLGVTVIFEKENLDTSKMSGETMLAIQAMKAQRESLSLSGNLKRGNRMRMKNGTYVNRSTPYGYALHNKKLEIVPEEAEIVRRIFAGYLSGSGYAAIAESLNNDGIPRRMKNVPWYANAVQYTLTNVTYIGDTLWQKTYATDTLPIKQLRNRGAKSQFYVSNDHEAIISREDFERVQTLIAERRAKHYSGETSEHLLSKKIYCGECGSVFRRKEINGKVYWTCRAHDRDKALCPVTQIPESEILAAFKRVTDKLREYSEYVLSPLSEQLEAVAERKQRSNIKLSEINKELADLAGQVHSLNRLNAKGIMEPTLLVEKSNELNSKQTTLRRTKSQLLAEANQDSKPQAVADLIDALTSGCDETGLFGEIVERVIVSSGNDIQFRLRCGLALTEEIERGMRFGGLAENNAIRLYGE